MKHRVIGLIALLATGCAHQREAVAPRSPVAVRDSAVSVQAPFVNVQIGRPTSSQAHHDRDGDRDEDELADSEE